MFGWFSALPAPDGSNFEELSPSEVMQRFDSYKDRESYPVFAMTLGVLFQVPHFPLRAFRKERSLPALVSSLRKAGQYPLVDRRAQLVFCLSGHTALRAALYAVYADLPITDANHLVHQSTGLAKSYTRAGMGYHWSSVGGKYPLGKRTYRAGKADKEAWQAAATLSR